MSNDKQILYNMISREVENIVSNISPRLGVFSGTLANYIIKYIDPYVDMFFMGSDSLNTDAAGKFVSTEVNSRIQNFIKDFNAAKAKDSSINEL